MDRLIAFSTAVRPQPQVPCSEVVLVMNKLRFARDERLAWCLKDTLSASVITTASISPALGLPTYVVLLCDSAFIVSSDEKLVTAHCTVPPHLHLSA